MVDFGAGTGVLTTALARAAGSVLAIELDPALAARLATQFADTPNVVVLHADVCDVPLPCTPYRVVANPPFGRTAAILHRLLDHPDGGLVRADLVVQWQVARHRARVDDGPPLDLLGAIWAPWWRFAPRPPAPGRFLPSPPGGRRGACSRSPGAAAPRPVDDFERYASFVRDGFRTRADAPPARCGGVGRTVPGLISGLHSPDPSANMD